MLNYLITAFLFIFILSSVTTQKVCQKRTDFDSRCQKPCTSDADCSKKRACVCDGVCGMSCVRRGMRCRDDFFKKPSRGRMIIEGRGHGQKIRYKCNRGYTLSGPSVMICSGIRKWKPWDQGKPACKRTCPDPGHIKDGRRIGKNFEVKKRIRFICNPGYKMHGAATAVCGRDLQWSNPSPVCKVESCSSPSLPSNAEIRSGEKDSYLYGDRIYLKCDSGYARIGRPVITCTGKRWTGTSFRCAPKSCGDPGVPSNGRREGEVFTYRSTVRYSCKRGYTLIGQSSRRCLENQKWRGTLPRCEVKDCGSAPKLENGRYRGYSTIYRATQKASCHSGYTLVGASIAKCDENGWTFQGQKPTCKADPTDCYSIPDIENGQPAKRVVYHGGKVEYRCNRGFELDLTPFQTCNDGNVEGQQPKCNEVKPKDCTNIPRIRNADLPPNKVDHGMTLKYQCYAGYGLSSQSVQKCQDGVLTGRKPYCYKIQPKDCTNIPRIQNAARPPNKVYHGMTLKYQCNAGYALSSQSVQKCQDGVLTGNRPSCIQDQDSGYIGCYSQMGYYRSIVNADSITSCKEECRKLPRKFAGLRNGGTCYCSNEYKTEWQEKDCNMKCKFDQSSYCGGYYPYSVYKTGYSADCTNVPRIRNAKMPPSSVRHGDYLQYQCNAGYVLRPRRAKQRCQHGVLVGNRSSCMKVAQAKHCTSIQSISNAARPPNKVNHGSTLRYQCYAGYALSSQSVQKCQDGVLTGNTPSCVQVQSKDCTNIPSIRNAAQPPNKVNHGMTLKYQCNAGYALNSQSEQECQDGFLTGNTPSCIQVQLKDCTNIPTIANAELPPPTVSHGNDLKYRCKPGYTLDSQSTQRCNDENLQGKAPSCRAVDDLRARYVGCYKDADERVLDTAKKETVDLYSDVSITEQCIVKCGKIYAVKYAGLQFGRQCFCGDVHDTLGISDTSCSMDCEDYSKMKCGDVWANSVYKTGCPKPIAPENGQTEDKWYNPNERALYQCSLDHDMKGKGQTCDGFKWIGSVPKCIPDTKCPSTFDDENLEVLANSKEEGSLAVFRCKGKYILTGDAVATCKNKKWTGKRHCELSPCRKTLGPNYTYSSKEVVHGSYAVRSCSKEGKIINQMCDNGKWKITSEKSCKESAKSDCTPPNQINNGTVTVDGNLATFSCFSGFKLVGYTQLTCLKGIWDKIPPKCIQYG